jgi:hypothetical protein
VELAGIKWILSGFKVVGLVALTVVGLANVTGLRLSILDLTKGNSFLDPGSFRIG